MPDHIVVARRGAPAVVVVHDRYGLLPHVAAVCGALAAAGLSALAVDLYLGRTTTDEAEAAQLLDSLEPATTLQRLAGAVRDLRRSDVLAPRIAALGYGSGAAQALEAAAAGLFDAVVAYGGTPEPPALPLPCPVMVHAGVAADDPHAWRQTVQFLGGRTDPPSPLEP